MPQKPSDAEWTRAHQSGKGITFKTSEGYVRAMVWGGDVYWSENNTRQKKPLSELKPGDIKATGIFG